jgi:hypothetical protein
MWSRKAALREGLEPKGAAERLWLLTSVEQYLLATNGLGWTPDDYESWLGDLLDSQQPTANSTTPHPTTRFDTKGFDIGRS